MTKQKEGNRLRGKKKKQVNTVEYVNKKIAKMRPKIKTKKENKKNKNNKENKHY